jgi:hypothetical protein
VRLINHLRHNVIAYLALVLAIGASGGYAFAATSTKTIHACVMKHSGELLLKNKCTRGESKLVWNQQGPAGAQGKAGATGAAGATPYSAEGKVGSSGGYSGTGFISAPVSTGEYQVTLTGPDCTAEGGVSDSLVVSPEGNPGFPATTSAGSYDVADVNGTTSPGVFDVYVGEIVNGTYTPVDDDFDVVGSC